MIANLKAGQEQTLVVGMGHGTCTCEGAAFEYVFNVDHQLREAGVRDRARLVYLTNEAQLGDFGVGGMTFEEHGFQTSSELWTASLFRERGVEPILGAHVERVEEGKVYYETLDGEHHELAFDFAMLLPPFGGVPLAAYDRGGNDITGELFTPAGFMKVDADYTAKPYERVACRATGRRPTRSRATRNVFAVGIAFAPPHQISQPRTSAERHGDHPVAATHRDALGRDGQDRGPDDRRPDQVRRRRAGALGLDGRDGRGLRGLGRRRHAHGIGGLDDDAAGRARLRDATRPGATWPGRPASSGSAATG